MTEDKAAQAAAARRKAHVGALQNERDYLARTPEPDEARIAAVDEQIAEYSEKPTSRKRETRKES